MVAGTRTNNTLHPKAAKRPRLVIFCLVDPALEANMEGARALNLDTQVGEANIVRGSPTVQEIKFLAESPCH